jgi:hypothetical protein
LAAEPIAAGVLIVLTAVTNDSAVYAETERRLAAAAEVTEPETGHWQTVNGRRNARQANFRRVENAETTVSCRATSNA